MRLVNKKEDFFREKPQTQSTRLRVPKRNCKRKGTNCILQNVSPKSGITIVKTYPIILLRDYAKKLKK